MMASAGAGVGAGAGSGSSVAAASGAGAGIAHDELAAPDEPAPVLPVAPEV